MKLKSKLVALAVSLLTIFPAIAIAQTVWFPTGAPGSGNLKPVANWGLEVPGISGVGPGTECLQISSAGVITATGSACGGAGSSPGGSNTYVQFNDSGAFGGDAGLTYIKASDILNVGSIGVGTTATPSSTLHVIGSFQVSATSTFNQLTASTVPYINASKILTSSAVSPTELGYLSGVTSAIQTQLDGKQATLTTGNLTANSPLSFNNTRQVIGGAAAVSIQNAAADGSTLGAAAFTAADFDAASGVISIDYSNGQAAASGVKGFLTAADWSTFNGKQAGDSTLTALAAYNTNGILVQTAADTFAGRTITGTSNRLSVSNGNGVSGNPTLDIDAAYVGQTSITTLGTIGTGTWNAGIIPIAYGGTATSSIPADNGIFVSNGSAWLSAVLPSCSTASTSKLLYNSTTHAFSCGTDQTGAGGSGITSLNGQTGSTQTFATSSAISGFDFTSSGDTHTLSIGTASAATSGLLLAADWTTFNAKQPAGNYITALTGDVTASGPGSAAATIASNAVALGADTTGNYLATLADDGQNTITVNNSGSETAAVTLRVIDVNCTDCLGTTEIADSYLLNTGDTASGNYDFSGIVTAASTTIGSTAAPSSTLHVVGTFRTTGAATIGGNLTTNITGSTQCVHADSSGVLSGTGSDCGAGGGGGDILATLVNSENIITTSSTLSLSTMNVASGTVNLTLTLPTAVGNTNKMVGLRGASGFTGAGSIVATSTQMIDNATTTLGLLNEDVYIFKSDGSNWNVITRKIATRTGSSRLASQYALSTSSGTYGASGLTVTLPVAGQYELFFNLRTVIIPADNDIAYMVAKIVDTTASADVTDSERFLLLTQNENGLQRQLQSAYSVFVTVTQPSVVEVYAKRVWTGASGFTTSDIGSDVNGWSTLLYNRIK